MSEGMQTTVTLKERISAHLAIARLDHSIKNLFVLPGVIVPLSVYPAQFNRTCWWSCCWRLCPSRWWPAATTSSTKCWTRRSTGCTPSSKNRPAARGRGEHTGRRMCSGC